MRPEGLQSLSLATAEARSLDSVLDGVVRGLAAEPGVALARVWLVDDAGRELRLVASAGASIANPKETWTRLDGDFSRIPVGVRKVGLVASSGKAILVEDDAPRDPHIARPDWARREKVRA